MQRLPRPNAVYLVALAIGLGACGGRAASVAVPTPDKEIAAPPDCAFYVGSASGNDTSMRMKMALCPSPQGIVGWVQLSSRQSGWSLRDVVGSVGPNGQLDLRDARVVENHPSADWELCIVDQYKLRKINPVDVEGTYVSTACTDTAAIALKRVQ